MINNSNINNSGYPKDINGVNYKTQTDIALIDFCLSLKETIDDLYIKLDNVKKEMQSYRLENKVNLDETNKILNNLQDEISPEILKNYKKKYEKLISKRNKRNS